MSYESGTNGIGVGQRYGEREVGNVQGVTCAVSGEGRIVFEFDAAGTVAGGALEAQAFSIPESNAVITKVYVEVEEAFTAGDVTVDVDGATILAADVVLTAETIVEGSLLLEPTVITAASIVTVSTDLVTGTAGYAKVIVEFTRV